MKVNEHHSIIAESRTKGAKRSTKRSKNIMLAHAFLTKRERDVKIVVSSVESLRK